MAKDLRKVHFVVSTHWDREWYQSFQGFRYRLVVMLDQLLDTMEKDPRFAHFDTDGQAIVLEDYLAIRSEKTEKIKDLVQQGKLCVGPWYVLPDEFLVSGESLIRNLKEGIRVAESFGKSSRAGFVCDIFGHTGQIPQILRGCGIDSFLMWRGANEKDRTANFRWQSPDGSEVLTYRFGPMWGYCDYDFRVRRANQIDAKPTRQEMVDGLVALIPMLAERTATQTLLVFDGGDHIEIEPTTPDLIEEANKRLEAQGFRIEMSTLPKYCADIATEQALIKDVIVGELREPACGSDEQWLIPGVLSSRMHLKLKNRECENLLCQWAEPFSAMARRYGLKGSESFLHSAWRTLLENHPHDSICGCSIDQVHKDMEFRFDQVEGIAHEVLADSLKHMIRAVPGEVTNQRFPVLVANPLPYARNEMVDLTLEIPADGPTYQEFFGFEPKPGFRIYADGQEVPYQLVHQDMNRSRFGRKLGKFPQGFRCHLVDVSVELALPALGTRTLWIETVSGPTRHPGAGLATSRTVMENGFLSVDIAPDGTISVQDMESGQMYTALLGLEDCADIGDGWYHGVAVNDEIFTSQGSPAAISLVHNGPAKATFRIEVSMEVPAQFDFTRMVRSQERKTLKVTHWVTLRRNARYLEVTTEVDNTIRDHRLRVLFPSDFFDVDTYWADAAFDCVERPIALREDNYTYKELEVETKPQYTWTAVVGENSYAPEGEKGGLAVVSCGLPESAVLDTENREIALTLLRSFRKAVFTDGNEGGQIPGRHRCDYRIALINGELDPVALGKAGQELSGGIKAAQRYPFEEPITETVHPDSFSLLEVEGEVLVTSVRAAGEKDLLVRLYNPNTKGVQAGIKMQGGLVSAQMCSLLDEVGETVPVKDGKVSIKVRPKKIVTVLLTPGGIA